MNLYKMYHPESGSTFVGPWTQDVADQGCYPISPVVPAGHGYASLLPDMDFETYSGAGYVIVDGKRKSAYTQTKSGLKAVGSYLYSIHPSTEVLCLAYDLKDGIGKRLWKPGMADPHDLFAHIRSGGLIESWNTTFEHHIWNNVCHARMGWPRLSYTQQRDAMAKSRAWGLPGALGEAAKVIRPDVLKDGDGKRLLNKFSVPRSATKKDPRNRILPSEDPADAQLLYNYCVQDIATESALSECIPDLNAEEEEFWLNTCKANYTGVGARIEEVNATINILEQAYPKYNALVYQYTNGEVEEASKVQQIINWMQMRYGIRTKELDDEKIEELLAKSDLPPPVQGVLEVRQMIGSAGVKKVYAMQRLLSPDQRIRDLFIYHGARTGRDTGSDVQLQNLTKNAPKIQWCGGCEKPMGLHHNDYCPHCGGPLPLLSYLKDDSKDWTWEAVDHALEAMKTGSLEWVEYVFGDAVLAVSGCIRGLIVAKEGHDLIASDYSSIEAVVLAALAGEQWRIDAFHAKKDIYLMGASMITGNSYEWYFENGGKKHPDRQYLGKISELALGYFGWLGAWRNFDKTDKFSDDEIKKIILQWRAASPAIVEFWGGQSRGKPWEDAPFAPYGIEGAALMAILNPGTCYAYRSITYGVKDNVLYCQLPSGRSLAYHRPRADPDPKNAGRFVLSYEGWNSNPKMGAKGWVRINTYGGRLTENIVQAVSRDIMVFAVNNLERAGYPCVIRVHDEIVAEIPHGFGSIEEFEAIMATLPPWAQGWPVRAAGGWRGLRYRKE